MKASLHPTYYSAQVTCACGNSFVTGSTMEKIHTEICSACHPFYTGKQKFVDNAGRIDKFSRILSKANQGLIQAKKIKESARAAKKKVVKK